MAVKLKLSALAEGHWYEYAIRFVLGGAVTMLAGWIATEWGPVIGGLFLAFPARYSPQAPRWLKNMSAKGRRRPAFQVASALETRPRLRLLARCLGASD
jgi:hypothetical protein